MENDDWNTGTKTEIPCDSPGNDVFREESANSNAITTGAGSVATKHRGLTKALIALILAISLFSSATGGFVMWLCLQNRASTDSRVDAVNGLNTSQASLSLAGSMLNDEENTIKVVEMASPGVVQVRVTLDQSVTRSDELPDFFNLPLPIPRTKGNGSGFVYDLEGHIITNNHVVQDSSKIEIVLSSGKVYEGRITGADPLIDIAVIKIDANPAELHPLVLGDSDDIKVGQKAIVVGSPLATGSSLGLDRSSTVTQGIISAKDRSLPIQSKSDPSVKEFSVENLIQIDAAVNPGNSGGPLLDSSGKVVGVVTALVTDANSIGLAVPINVVKRVIPELAKGKQIKRAYLGITYVGLDDLRSSLGQKYDLLNIPETSGALIIKITAGSAADIAGLQGGSREMMIDSRSVILGGDIITAVDGKPIEGSDLASQVLKYNPGDEVEFTYLRDGVAYKTKVKLGER